MNKKKLIKTFPSPLVKAEKELKKFQEIMEPVPSPEVLALEAKIEALEKRSENEQARADHLAREVEQLKANYNRLVDEKMKALMDARKIDKAAVEMAMDDHNALCKNPWWIFKIVNHIPKHFAEEQVFLVKHFVTENKELLHSKEYVEWAKSMAHLVL